MSETIIICYRSIALEHQLLYILPSRHQGIQYFFPPWAWCPVRWYANIQAIYLIKILFSPHVKSLAGRRLILCPSRTVGFLLVFQTSRPPPTMISGVVEKVVLDASWSRGGCFFMMKIKLWNLRGSKLNYSTFTISTYYTHKTYPRFPLYYPHFSPLNSRYSFSLHL